MTPERWARVKDLFADALEREPASANDLGETAQGFVDRQQIIRVGRDYSGNFVQLSLRSPAATLCSSRRPRVI